MSKRGQARSKLWQREKVRSGFEQRIRTLLENNRIKFEYETEKFKYTIERTYTPDFILFGKKGKKIYVEAKGRLDSDSKIKLRAMKQQHPDIDLRILFQRNQPLRKGAKTTYIEWATKLGYECAEGEDIPKKWLT